MPYREKTAWLALVAMALTFGPYFTLVATGHFPVRPMPDFHQLAAYAGTALSQVVLLGIGHLVLRLRAPEDARMPPDERDLGIMRRAMTCAYGTLIAGMILVGVIMPFTTGGWAIVNAALFWLVVAEVVHYGVIAMSYRVQS